MEREIGGSKINKKRKCLFVLALLLLTLLLPNSVITKTAFGDSKITSKVEKTTWIANYHFHPEPDRLPKEVEEWLAQGFLKENSYQFGPLALGFLSGALGDSPRAIHKVEEIAKAYSDEKEKKIIAEAVHLAKGGKLEGENFPISIPSADVASGGVEKEKEIDFWWGRYYASGEKEAIEKIVSAFNCFKEIKASEEVPPEKLNAFKKGVLSLNESLSIEEQTTPEEKRILFQTLEKISRGESEEGDLLNQDSRLLLQALLRNRNSGNTDSQDSDELNKMKYPGQ